MRFKQNKGFTIIELMIAIAIITTVVFLGYRVINKSNDFSKEQSQTNNIQLGFNNLRKYMTEDFKKSNEFKSPKVEDMNSDYKYEIKKGSDTIDYKVEYKTKGSNKLYSIKRIKDESEIVFIENQPVKKSSININDFEKPLIISYNSDNNMYSIKVNYGKSQEQLYTFDIYSGDVEVAGNTLPPVGKVENYMSYCLERAQAKLEYAYSELLPSESSKFGKELKRLFLDPIQEILPYTKEKPMSESSYNKVLSVLNKIINDNIPYFKEEVLNKPKDEDISKEFNEAKFYIQTSLYTLQFLNLDVEDSENTMNPFEKSKMLLNANIRDVHMKKFVEKSQPLKSSVASISNNTHFIYLDGQLNDFNNKIITEIQMYLNNQLKSGISEQERVSIANYINTKTDEIMEFQVYKLQGYVNENIRNDKNIHKFKFEEIYQLSEEIVNIINGDINDNIVKNLINIKALVYNSNYYSVEE